MAPSAGAARADHPLAGLWVSTKVFGPWTQGELIIRRDAAGWSGEMAGRRAPATFANNEVVFSLPEHGVFRGRLEGRELRGYWTPFSDPGQTIILVNTVVLAADGPGRWRGDVVPIEERMTL